MEDSRLIELVALKDEEAFNELYYKYQQLVYYVVYKIVKNREDTIDIVQDTFFKMYMNASSFYGGNFKYWLLQIAKREAINYVERIKNRNSTVLSDDIVSDKVDNNFSLIRFENLLSFCLNDEEKNIVILKIVFNYTFDEIADELAINKSHIFRKYRESLEKIRKLLSYNDNEYKMAIKA